MPKLPVSANVGDAETRRAESFLPSTHDTEFKPMTMSLDSAMLWPPLHPPALERLFRNPPDPASLPPSQRHTSDRYPTLQDELDALDWEEEEFLHEVSNPRLGRRSDATRRWLTGSTRHALIECSPTASRNSKFRLLVARAARSTKYTRRRRRGEPPPSLALAGG